MRRRGFTLLELLIVIIIIGLLASIGIVQYAKAVATTKNSQAKAILGEMRKAALAYQSLNGSWPSSTTITVDLDSDGTSDVVFAPPSSTDFTWSIAAGTGRAVKTATAGAGVNSWTINLSNGTLTSS